MIMSPANPTRHDPYKNFKFRMKWEGNCVVGISKVGRLTPVGTSHGAVNLQAMNLLQQFNIHGDLMLGDRICDGDDHIGCDANYARISRLGLFIESNLHTRTKWAVFEPNTPGLWGRVSLNVGAFMQGLSLQGAFQGKAHKHAHFGKCDAENNPQSSIDQGIVNILVGFAPLYPAEFVVIPMQQMAPPANCRPPFPMLPKSEFPVV